MMWIWSSTSLGKWSVYDIHYILFDAMMMMMMINDDVDVTTGRIYMDDSEKTLAFQMNYALTNFYHTGKSINQSR